MYGFFFLNKYIYTIFQDKFEKISDLLSGNQVRTGDIQFTASEHPLGIKYCTFLLAKKFIVSYFKRMWTTHGKKISWVFFFYHEIDTRNNCYE